MKLFVILCSLLSGVVFCSNNDNNESCNPPKRRKDTNDEELLLPNQQHNPAATNDADSSVSSNSKLSSSLGGEKFTDFSIETILGLTNSNKRKFTKFSKSILNPNYLSETTRQNGWSLPTFHKSIAPSVESVSSLPSNKIGQALRCSFTDITGSSDTSFSSLPIQSAPKQFVAASTLAGKNNAHSSQNLPATTTTTKLSVSSSKQSLTLFLSFLESPLVRTIDDYFGFEGTDRTEFAHKSRYYILSMDAKYFYHQTNEFNRLLRFRYTSYTCTTLFKNSEFLSKISEPLLAKTFEAMYSVINSIEPHLQPFFNLFKYTTVNGLPNQEYLEVPTYFIFTSISYLMKEPEDSVISNTLKALLEIYFHGIIDQAIMANENWALIVSYLGKYFPIPQPTIQASYQKYFRFNFSTLAFIHSEMRKKNNSVEAKRFFTKSWKVCCNNFFSKKFISGSIDQDFKISFLNYERMHPQSLFHKLYQIKFTELVFKNWSEISELLAEYHELISEFGRDIDFRRRLFNRLDFEQLKNGLESIKESINGCSSEDLPTLRCFFLELEYFANFKSLQFLYDLHNEMKVSLDKISKYGQTIETIGKIDQILNEIKKNISKKILLSDGTKANPSFLIKELLENLFLPIISIKPDDLNQDNILIRKLNEVMKKFEELFQKSLIYLPEKMTRFQCAEFIAQITEAIESNSPDKINKIFQSDEFKKLDALMVSFPKAYLSNDKKLYEPRKIYLKEFKTFLHYFTQ